MVRFPHLLFDNTSLVERLVFMYEWSIPNMHLYLPLAVGYFTIQDNCTLLIKPLSHFHGGISKHLQENRYTSILKYIFPHSPLQGTFPLVYVVFLRRPFMLLLFCYVCYDDHNRVIDMSYHSSSIDIYIQVSILYLSTPPSPY